MRAIVRPGFGSWQTQEAACVVSDIAEVEKLATFANDVEEVAVFAGRGVSPFTGWSLRRLPQPNEHGAARRVSDIADQPVAPVAPSVGKIVAAHRLGLARKTVHQVGSFARPHATS